MDTGKFLSCLEFVLRHEGGYVDDPVDRGGKTKYGISKRSYPNLDIANLTKEEAAKIYRHDYWAPIQGDKLPNPVALVVFDTAVNAGVRRAIKMLQEMVGVNDDGIIGPETIEAISLYPRDYQDLAHRYCWRKMQFYVDIVKGRPSQIRFLRGWTNRVAELSEEIG